MGPKSYRKKKNNIVKHGEHSTRSNKKIVVKINNKIISVPEYTVCLGPQIDIDRLKEYAKKRPEPEELTFGINQRYPKRRKTTHTQKKNIETRYVGPFNIEYITGMTDVKTIDNFPNTESTPKSCETNCNKTKLQSSKSNPESVLDFINQPSVNKLSGLLDLMQTNPSQYNAQLNNLTSREQRRKIYRNLKKYLFELFHQQFCEVWLHKKTKKSLGTSKHFQKLMRLLMRHKRCRQTICSMDLKKFILYNGGLMGFHNKAQVVICINKVRRFIRTIQNKCFKMLRMRFKKKVNRFSQDNELPSIKLYHTGTTKRKKFLEIIDEYKNITTINRLSCYEVADIRHAYEQILEPGQCIDKADLERCAKENYDFNKFQDGIEDLITTDNDNFVFDDYIPEKKINFFSNIPTFQIENYFKADKFHKRILDYFKEVLKDNKNNVELMDISANDLEGTTSRKYSEAETSSNNLKLKRATNSLGDKCINTIDIVLNLSYNVPTSKMDNYFKTDKLAKYILEWVKEIQSHNYFIRKYDKNNVETNKDNSKNKSIEVIKKENYIQCTVNEDHDIEHKTLIHSLREVKLFIDCIKQERTAIINYDKDISTCDLEEITATHYSGAETSSKNLELERVKNTLEENNSPNSYSKIIESCTSKLLLNPINLTKLEKKMLSIIILTGLDLYKINWKRYLEPTKTRIRQILRYFRRFKKALCDNLNLNHLSLKDINICDMIDVEKLLKSIQVETCVLQENVTFSEVGNFLIWPLGKVIVNNIISQRSPTINILYNFVKNIITKFCEKVKEFLHKSGLRIVLNKESLFEILSNEQDVLSTEPSLKKNVNALLSPVNNDEFSNADKCKNLNSNHFCLTYFGFSTKKNCSNKEISRSVIDILKSDDFIYQSWKECKNSHRFISKLLEAGITLPIDEDNAEHGSKFVEVYARWFCEEYLQDDKFYKLAISIFKNIFIFIDTTSECTVIKFEDAINKALIILHNEPCFLKAYESYLNTSYPKCLTNSKPDSTKDAKNLKDYKGVNLRSIEEPRTQLNENFETNSIDNNNVDMSLVTSTSNEFNVLNNEIIKDLVTPDPQSSSNYDFNNDLIQNFLNENIELSSDNFFESIGCIDDNSLFNTDTNLLGIDNSNYNVQLFNEFNEDHPFDDEITINNSHNEFSFGTYLPNDNNMLVTSNPDFQQAMDLEASSLTSSLDQIVNHGVSDEELNSQVQAKNMEEFSMISSDQIVNFDQNDEINLNDLNMAVDDQYGFYNAGVLLPP